MKNKNKFQYTMILILCVLLCACSGDEGEVILIGSDESETVQIIDEQSEPAESHGMIRVYVCGAVKNPGVVEIPDGSRVEDALYAAGGFAAGAAQGSVNLAAWVTDGEMICFSTVEEVEEKQVAEEGLVNINTADLATLCTLPGIGESRAADIIAYREAHGLFASCEDIMSVSGIKTSVYEKICDKITVK